MDSSIKAEQDVLAERARQRAKYDATDGDYQPGTLATAGAHLACPSGVSDMTLLQYGADWAREYCLKYIQDRRQELVVSCALIMAEIEKMDAAAKP